MDYYGYSARGYVNGQWFDITWLDAAYTALGEGRLWFWIQSRHPSRLH